MKKLYSVFAALLIAVFAFSACAPTTPAAPAEPPTTSEVMPADTETVGETPVSEEAAPTGAF